MGRFVIQGANKLYGEAVIKGAKNAALPILAATVLATGESIIKNCPSIADVKGTVSILNALGCNTSFQNSTVIVDSTHADNFVMDGQIVNKMRSSIIFMGAVLGRFKEVKIGYPGGCEIGERPIDLHLKAFRKMGVEIKEQEGYIHCYGKEIHGACINLDFASVGATENIMLLACCAKGETILYNAAREPEIMDLAKFLNKAGANIRGAGTETICIEGVQSLNGCTHRLIPDRIEAGTYLCAAAAAGGEIFLRGIDISIMEQTVLRLKETGCDIFEYNDGMYLKSSPRIKPLDMVSTQPYPGFPTDMQPQLMSLLTLTQGTSIIIETVFEARFKHIVELCKMGAEITFRSSTAIIRGVEMLYGTHVWCRDLRGGAALIIAGLAAQGETVVFNSKYVERGYEDIAGALRGLGARITLEEEDEKDRIC